MKQPSIMSRPVALIAVVLAVILTGRAVDATVASTCKEAAASDVRVSLQLCLSQLSNQRGAADADAWGLAKVASLAGVNNVALAADDVKTLLAGNPSLPMKQALAKCAAVYSQAGFAFAEASDEINQRSYATGKKKLEEALAQAQQCNAAFGIHGVTLPQPLAQHTVDSIQIAIIAQAITGLIK
ncbi:pectinesterase inhibitor 12-like [Lolium rigidum]|uniref:pectinesterase inhibitor 12-like n=1 Tax=Lolium rigidum TaxID=89674 RepID=UPI001F5C844A|nr:pectinesterase inhibitor 12-like [Lolium rigidum]